ncbi:MAG: isopentenyl phosphate kinase [Candidatus Thermoplasmatota archaeon]
MLLVKLGGSAITDKTQALCVRPAVLYRLSRELGTFEGEVIVVHGAGSFGHIKAARYKLHKGLRGKDAVMRAAEVQADVRTLDLEVIRALQRAGLPAVSLPPSLMVRHCRGMPKSADLRPFHQMIKSGFVPVTFGDMVMDEEWGASICSGDTLMVLLAGEFEPERAIFVTDVDGVYDHDPKGCKGAKFLPKIDPSLARTMTSSPGRQDVTGAMGSKLDAAFAIASLGTEVYVLNGLVRGRLRALLSGQPGRWTQIGGG